MIDPVPVHMPSPAPEVQFAVVALLSVRPPLIALSPLKFNVPLRFVVPAPAVNPPRVMKPPDQLKVPFTVRFVVPVIAPALKLKVPAAFTVDAAAYVNVCP